MAKGKKTGLQLIEELKAAKRKIRELQSRASKYERIEKDLTHFEHFYQTLFENSGTATIVIEPDTTISMMNNDFANTFYAECPAASRGEIHFAMPHARVNMILT